MRLYPVLKKISETISTLASTYAAKVHKHSASDITSGTLDDARIGSKTITSDKLADEVSSKLVSGSTFQVKEVSKVVYMAANTQVNVDIPISPPSGFTPVALAGIQLRSGYIRINTIKINQSNNNVEIQLFNTGGIYNNGTISITILLAKL